jgi:ribonuclease HI
VSREILVIHTDGGSRGNPGPSAAGVWYPQLGRGDSKYLGIQTNNFAEYSALILGLEQALEMDERYVQVFTDSTLMANQMKGVWRVKSDEIMKLWTQATLLAEQLLSFQIDYFPRAQNADADALVNGCLDVTKESLHCV